jgi:hypothetical protein
MGSGSRRLSCLARVAVTATTDRIVDRAEQLQDEGIEAAGFTADLTDEQQAAGWSGPSKRASGGSTFWSTTRGWLKAVGRACGSGSWTSPHPRSGNTSG